MLFPNSRVIGSSKIGKNCAIGAGVQIYNEIISENSSVSFRKSGINIDPINFQYKINFFIENSLFFCIKINYFIVKIN